MLVWELVRGESLDRAGDRLGDGDVAAVGVELLDALAYAHHQGIIHRDVKPQNVMLDEDGHVKVMDFGIAHLMDSDTLTGDGDVIGTIAYMSPEQAQGKRVRAGERRVLRRHGALRAAGRGAPAARGHPGRDALQRRRRAPALAGRAACRPARRPGHAHRRRLRAAARPSGRRRPT